MTYKAPLADQRFALETVAELAELAKAPAFEAATPDIADAILEEAAKLAEQGFAPLSRVGDEIGAVWNDGAVTLPEGFAATYADYIEGGWGTLGNDPRWGGQGMPFALTLAVIEQFNSANLAFALKLLLTAGAVAAIQTHGSADLHERYLPKMVSGEWSGTMNLTEPQAGSDVGALRTRAEPAADGTWRIKGSKIFITWGEHDLTENIVHLVLARTPGSPGGTKGISLFLVPKVLEDGTRNDLRCVSIEHKLGIHASPTCTMSYGDNDNCVGYMVGPENGGMRAMFTMMNHARISVGMQGVAVAERAYQGALAYAKERVQGKRIVEFADVRRMLLTMKATTEGIRALTYYTAAAVDRGHLGDKDGQLLADLLTPVAKGYATDMSVEVASTGVQIFGGMGFIEETGAAQHLRDSRILPIYEGTNGIQALDLVGRKLGQGRWEGLFTDIDALVASLPHSEELDAIGKGLAAGLADLRSATDWIVASNDPQDVAAGATPYLRMFGIVTCGYLLAKQASVAAQRLERGEGDSAFLTAKIATARFFAEQIVPQCAGLLPAVTAGAAPLYAIAEGAFAL